MSQLEPPRASTVAVLSAIVGVAMGSLAAIANGLSRPMQIGSFRVVAAPSADSAKATTDETIFDFGSMGAEEAGAHQFKIVNGGKSVLSLSKGSSSCSCTIGGLDREDVPPGEAAMVSIDWKTKGQGGPFRQRVSVLTNDPLRSEISFEISGIVVPKWRLVPEEVVFDRISSASGANASIRLLTYGLFKPELRELIVEPVSGTPEATRSTSPMVADFRVLSERELEAESPATGGFVIDITVPPGLPVGPLRRTVRIRLENLAALMESGDRNVTIDIPVKGSVAGDIVIAGNGWDSSNEMVALGNVSSTTGGGVDLFLTVKGPERERIKPVVREVVPDSISVELGEPSPIGAGTVWKVPIQIRVPVGSKTCNHLGSRQGPLGRIVLETGLASTPELTLPVRLAIGP
ncbi:MAG: DUF1573 domain-containing protein [Planctomycetaceae bacterium]